MMMRRDMSKKMGRNPRSTIVSIGLNWLSAKPIKRKMDSGLGKLGFQGQKQKTECSLSAIVCVLRMSSHRFGKNREEQGQVLNG